MWYVEILQLRAKFTVTLEIYLEDGLNFQSLASKEVRSLVNYFARKRFAVQDLVVVTEICNSNKSRTQNHGCDMLTK